MRANFGEHFKLTIFGESHGAAIGIVIDGFACGFGTGGSITGIGSALKLANPDTIVWAAEPENAAMLAGGNIGTHLQMGIGDGVIPAILDRSVIDKANRKIINL